VFDEILGILATTRRRRRRFVDGGGSFAGKTAG
jgi:hypothetical protein